jgi:DNA-3-methyladenine glycosylase
MPRLLASRLAPASSPELAHAQLLTRDFFARDPRRVARELLGKLLVRRERGHLLAGRIVETEAYLGQGDPAAHTAIGQTARNSVLFGPPGHAYVYFIYGIYNCVNVSCLPAGEAGGVLIRAIEPVVGAPLMARNRGFEPPPADKRAHALTSGPGRLCQALAITRRRDYGKDLVSPASDLILMNDGFRSPRIAVTPRIGITKAADRPLRYVIAGNPFVSGRKQLPG